MNHGHREGLEKMEYAASIDPNKKSPNGKACLFYLRASASFRHCETSIFGETLDFLAKSFLDWKDRHQIVQEHLSYAYVFIIPDDIHYADVIIRDDGGIDFVPAPEDSQIDPKRRFHRTALAKRLFGQ